MNVSQLRKQLGALLRLRPVPLEATGSLTPGAERDDQWRLEDVLDSPARVRLRNVRTSQEVEIYSDNIREFRRPDTLALRAQVTIRESGVELEPIFGSDGSHARIEALERAARARQITPEQRAKFLQVTASGPFGPVVLATRSPFPSAEQESFTMQLRKLLDEAGFGNKAFGIVNGFGTSVNPGPYLAVISSGDSPPDYFSNLAAGLFEIGLLSPDVPIGTNNPHAKPGLLYLFIPEK